MNTSIVRFASLFAASSLALAAQTTTKAPVRHTTTTSAAHKPATPAATATPTCEKLPTVADAIPSLGPGVHCLKTLYTISTTATHLDPALNADLKQSLEGINQSFSLQYVDTKIGTGELAQQRKFYTVHYSGYLIDGTKFDSSVDRNEPFSFPYGGHRVIQGWDSGFEGMHVGGKRRLYIPYQLAYGERGRPPQIPAKSELIFDMELISQSDTEPTPPTPPTPPQQPGQSAPASNPSTSPAGSATPPPTSSTQPSTPADPKKPQ